MRRGEKTVMPKGRWLVVTSPVSSQRSKGGVDGGCFKVVVVLLCRLRQWPKIGSPATAWSYLPKSLSLAQAQE